MAVILKKAEAARFRKAATRLERQPKNSAQILPRRHVTSQPETHVFLGKTNAAIAKGASGAVSVWSGTPGSETDTGYDITGAYNRVAAVAAGAWVTVTFIGGFPYLSPVECED